MSTVLAALGGAIGAVLRYVLDRRVLRWHDSPFLWGTLSVNVLGSLILGFLAGAALFGVRAEELQVALGVGLCGALTTFSTFGYQTVRLFADGFRWYAVANVAVSVLASVGAAVCGLLAAAAIWAP